MDVEQRRILMRHFPIWKYFPTATDRKFDELVKQFDQMVYDRIEEIRKNPKEPTDILGITLDAIKQEKFEISDQDIVRHMINFLWGAHDSTRNVLVMTIYAVTSHPEVYRKLMNEINTVVSSRDPTRDDIERMPYLQAVVNEVLRLYPSFPITGHRMVEPVELNGKTIPAFSEILGCVYSVHRDPQYWPDPEKFDPERWTTEESRAKIVDGSFVPFGGGRRRCIGEKLGLMDSQLWIVTIFQHFQFEFLSQSFNTMFHGVALTIEDGLKSKLTLVNKQL